MDASMRNQADLQAYLDKLDARFRKTFMDLVERASLVHREPERNERGFVVKVDEQVQYVWRNERDHSETAQVELQIAEQTAALVKVAEDYMSFIRDVQELWLFGGLDTLAKPADEEAATKRALDIANKIERLVKAGSNADK